MRKTSAVMVAMMLLGASCDRFHVCQYDVQVPAGKPEPDRVVWWVKEMGWYLADGETASGGSRPEASGRQDDQGRVRDDTLDERKRQIAAIAASFARRTEPQRARRLAALCYYKTLATPFMPIDMAEIALAETGSHRLSGKAVSRKGALGVWQLMPHRARSHGYAPREMKNDRKCADAAVRELAGKLAMARGNLTRAKKLYCGIGPEADAFEARRRQYRKEILESLRNSRNGLDEYLLAGTRQPSGMARLAYR